MAFTRFTQSSLTTGVGKYIDADAGRTPIPSVPTIGTATDGGTGTTVSVAFTPGYYPGNYYTVLSNPGSITATGNSSPITVSGLTTGTSYNFSVSATNNTGTSAYSAASNSVTPAVPPSFESIATYTGDGSSSVATFSSIPQTYKSLQIRISALGGTSQCITKFNGLTSGYTQHFLYGTGSTAAAGGSTGGNYFYSFWNINGMDGTYPLVQIIDVIDYNSTTKYKTFRALSGSNRNNTSTGEIDLWSGSNFSNTNAITSITIENTGTNFASGTTIALYGIKG